MHTNDIIAAAEKRAARIFKEIDDIALFNQKKVLDAFKKCRIEARHFYQSTGYGYDDAGRAALNAVFAAAFGSESAVVSPLIASGTHAIYLALSGILRPGGTVLSITGKPYDTLSGAIKGAGNGSLHDFGIKFREVSLKAGKIDFTAIGRAIKKTPGIKMIYIQRSCGYELRQALSTDDIRAAVNFIRPLLPDACIAVDNCYGEFTGREEPAECGADIMMGSLIKNPGGGIAPCGGYAAGKAEYIRLIENRLTVPGMGGEIGSYAAGYRAFFQGLFMAPHTTAQALKGSVLAGLCMEIMGFTTSPDVKKIPRDIIRAVKFGNKKDLVEFCEKIQAASPVDSFVTPVPWAMPGYDDQVIMAAGAFVQGASIELSCDAPIREPYVAYLQGGLTYEHVKIAIAGFLEGRGSHG